MKGRRSARRAGDSPTKGEEGRPSSLAIELGRIVGPLVVVFGIAVALLAVLDALPGIVGGEPRGVREYRSIDDAERQLGERLRLPAYVPGWLRWPPASIRVVSGPPACVAIAFVDRAGHEAVIVYQAGGSDAPFPEVLRPAGTLLERADVRIGERPGVLTRLTLRDGRTVHEVDWASRGRRFAIRSAGGVNDLLLMAGSME